MNPTDSRLLWVLLDISNRQTWDNFVDCSSFIYTGILNRILATHRTSFEDLFVLHGRHCNVDASHTGVESLNSLGLVEQYHQPLWNTI